METMYIRRYGVFHTYTEVSNWFSSSPNAYYASPRNRKSTPITLTILRYFFFEKTHLPSTLLIEFCDQMLYVRPINTHK